MRPVFAIVVWIIATSLSTSAEVGGIRGVLIDEDSQRSMPGRAVVFLCDAATGLPIMPDTRKPLDLSERSEKPFGFDGFWHVETDDDGSFEFNEVPAGSYRLFAQSWAGISGMPRGLPPDRDDPKPEPSAMLILHGVASHVIDTNAPNDGSARQLAPNEAVEVKAGETIQVFVKPLGTGVQRILGDPEAEHNYVLVSLNPTLGDPVLGPVGWDTRFLTGVIGLTRMEVPHLTIIGLPADTEVHVSLYNYDNSVGLGGGSFTAGKEPTVRLPIYAGWSNGKYQPPARLADLTAHLEQSGTKIDDLLPLERDWGKAYFDYVWQHARDKIEVPGYGQAEVIDILAANSYRSLHKSHSQRLERMQQQRKQSENAAR
jgi:hypothetical protein